MFKIENNYKMISDDSDSEDDIATLKRKSLIMIEQSLDSPCDVSPLQPSFMVEAEKPGQNIEKLLMERVMLRKELRLRSVQEMLVQTNHKLEQAETRLSEYEGLPGFKQYVAMCRLIRVSQEASAGGAGLIKRGVVNSCMGLYRLILATLGLPAYLFHQLPASFQLLCVSLVSHLASTVGESADNYTNECRERTVNVGSQQSLQTSRRRRNRRN